MSRIAHDKGVNKTTLKTTATNLVSQINAADEDGEGAESTVCQAAIVTLAKTLLAIAETEWSRSLIAELNFGSRQTVIAVGRKLKAA